MEEHGIILPPGVRRPEPVEQLGGRGMVVNESDLPDHVVMQAVQTHFEEHASVLGANQGTSFTGYSGNEGSLLARAKFRAPTNVMDEIHLARDLAERDDDVAATMGAILATAFGEGMQHTHEDEVTVGLFDKIGRHANLDLIFQEMLREWLISFQVHTVTVWTQEQFHFTPPGGDRQRARNVIAPLIGVLPAELIRVIDNDIFRTGTLAYKPASGAQEKWLEEFFAPKTTAARKAEMRREDPVLAAMVVERLQIEDQHVSAYGIGGLDPVTSRTLYRLNPRLVHRTAAPKGVWAYPRPPLTRNLALLEAKRLLNLMDYALLQGGANFLVVAKKGSDQRPAMDEEIGNLRETIKRATRTGVVIGDHRLSIEIITPDLEELLNADKRKLLARKITRAMLRVPDFAEEGAGAEGMRADVEIMSRVIESDRRTMRRHMENHIYDEVEQRNPQQFTRGAASIWFPKIVLQGLNYFTDLILKLRDRGDIPRKYAVEAGGFNYEAAVQQRRREKSSGDDRVLTPAAVPFNSPNGAGGAPTDNQGGRPAGTGPNNGAPGARQRTAPDARERGLREVAMDHAGEAVQVYEDPDEAESYYRAGVTTHAILEEFAGWTHGRITAFERRALEAIERGEWEPNAEGPTVVVPVNAAYELEEIAAIRLAPGLSILVGSRPDDRALVTRALCFRAPEFMPLDAEETAMRWGFPTGPVDRAPERRPAALPPGELEEEHAQRQQAERQEPTIIVMPPAPGARFRTVLDRDEHGNIVGSHPEPIEDPA